MYCTLLYPGHSPAELKLLVPCKLCNKIMCNYCYQTHVNNKKRDSHKKQVLPQLMI